jgi:hypothetical protein
VSVCCVREILGGFGGLSISALIYIYIFAKAYAIKCVTALGIT